MKLKQPVNFVFAGDRDIAVHILEFLIHNGHRPGALLLSGPKRATHAEELIRLCPFLPPERIFRGTTFKSKNGLAVLRKLKPDYITGIHFPYIIPPDVLQIPRIGFLNLHPAFLPWNRGWHTPSWAILDDTPVGATLHFMSEQLDAGDIIARLQVPIKPDDTAHTLYKKLKIAELTLFKDTWPKLLSNQYDRIPQDLAEGTSHKRQDLFRDDIQKIDLNATCTAEDLLRKLRALTTNDPGEAAYFEHDGNRFRVQVNIIKEK